MPIVTCPIDQHPMQEIDRNGIRIDICTHCRGVWLDRGELERVMNNIRDAVHQDMQHVPSSYGAQPQQPTPMHYQQPSQQQQAYQQKPRYWEDDDHDDYYKRTGYQKYPYKKSKLKSILDIFD